MCAVTILVDSARWAFHGRLWAHLVSDTSLDELHVFASQLDVPPRAFDGDHYDIPASLRIRALEIGALAVTSSDLMRRLRASGLRRRKRGGEHLELPRPATLPEPARNFSALGSDRGTGSIG